MGLGVQQVYLVFLAFRVVFFFFFEFASPMAHRVMCFIERTIVFLSFVFCVLR